jgi:hypothetical protein
MSISLHGINRYPFQNAYRHDGEAIGAVSAQNTSIVKRGKGESRDVSTVTTSSTKSASAFVNRDGRVENFKPVEVLIVHFGSTNISKEALFNKEVIRNNSPLSKVIADLGDRRNVYYHEVPSELGSSDTNFLPFAIARDYDGHYAIIQSHETLLPDLEYPAVIGKDGKEISPALSINISDSYNPRRIDRKKPKPIKFPFNFKVGGETYIIKGISFDGDQVVVDANIKDKEDSVPEQSEGEDSKAERSRTSTLQAIRQNAVRRAKKKESVREVGRYESFQPIDDEISIRMGRLLARTESNTKRFNGGVVHTLESEDFLDCKEHTQITIFDFPRAGILRVIKKTVVEGGEHRKIEYLSQEFADGRISIQVKDFRKDGSQIRKREFRFSSARTQVRDSEVTSYNPDGVFRNTKSLDMSTIGIVRAAKQRSGKLLQIKTTFPRGQSIIEYTKTLSHGKVITIEKEICPDGNIFTCTSSISNGEDSLETDLTTPSGIIISSKDIANIPAREISDISNPATMSPDRILPVNILRRCSIDTSKQNIVILSPYSLSSPLLANTEGKTIHPYYYSLTHKVSDMMRKIGNSHSIPYNLSLSDSFPTEIGDKNFDRLLREKAIQSFAKHWTRFAHQIVVNPATEDMEVTFSVIPSTLLTDPTDIELAKSLQNIPVGTKVRLPIPIDRKYGEKYGQKYLSDHFHIELILNHGSLEMKLVDKPIESGSSESVESFLSEPDALLEQVTVGDAHSSK